MSVPLPDAEVVFGDLRVRVRPLCGHDELPLAAEDTRASIVLLDALIEGPEGAADALTTPERDRLLAEVWRRTYGPRVQSSPRCAACDRPFDVDFDIDALMSAIWPSPPPRRLSAAGRDWRIPTGADELAIAGLDAEGAALALARRCALDGTSEPDPGAAAAFAAALEEEAPVLDLDLDARCPECGHGNQVGFRLQTFLLRALRQERSQLLAQVHRIAAAYGWALADILSLARETRLRFVALIEADASARRAA
jgi:hypothetical protein